MPGLHASNGSISACRHCDAGPIFEGYGARIAKDEFDITKETPGMTTTLAMKDLRHIRDLAKDSKVRPATRSRHTARDCCCAASCVKIAAACNQHGTSVEV